MSHAIAREGPVAAHAAACHAIALVHPVAEPRETASVLTGVLGFYRTEEGEEGSVVVDNGAVRLRLVRLEGLRRALAPPLELEVEAEDLDAATERLRSQLGGLRAEADRRAGADRLVRRLELGADVVVRLTRVLTEDDLGVLPPLPSGLDWHPEADRVVRRVLRSVPLIFRPAARERATRRAEELARERGEGRVGVATAVRGLADATPRFQHGTLRRALADEGIDLARHENEVDGRGGDELTETRQRSEGT